MKLLLLRRVVLAMIGVSLMLLAVFKVPLALVDGATASALGMFLVGVFGLWLLNRSRSSEASTEDQAHDPDSQGSVMSDEEL